MIQAIATSILALSNTGLETSTFRSGRLLNGISLNSGQEEPSNYSVTTSSVRYDRLSSSGSPIHTISLNDILPMGEGGSTSTVFAGYMDADFQSEMQSFNGKYSNRLGQTNWIKSYQQFQSVSNTESSINALFPFGNNHFGGAGYSLPYTGYNNLLVFDTDLSTGSTRQAVYDYGYDTIAHGGVSINDDCALVLGESRSMPSASMFCPWSSGVYLDETTVYTDGLNGFIKDGAVFNDQSVITISQLEDWDDADYALGISNISSSDMSVNWNTMVRLYDNSQTIRAQSVIVDPSDNSINVLGQLYGSSNGYDYFLGRFDPSTTSEAHIDQAYAYALCMNDCAAISSDARDNAPIGMGISSQNYLVVAAQAKKDDCIDILVIQNQDTLFGRIPNIRKYFCLNVPDSMDSPTGNLYVNANDEIVLGLGEEATFDVSSSITTFTLNGELKDCSEGTTIEELATSNVMLSNLALKLTEHSDDWYPTSVTYSRLNLDLASETWVSAGSNDYDDVNVEQVCQVSEFETNDLPIVADWGWDLALGEYAFITYPVFIVLGVIFIGLIIGISAKKCAENRHSDEDRCPSKCPMPSRRTRQPSSQSQSPPQTQSRDDIRYPDVPQEQAHSAYVAQPYRAPEGNSSESRQLDRSNMESSRFSESRRNSRNRRNNNRSNTFICCFNCCFVYNDNRRGDSDGESEDEERSPERRRAEVEMQTFSSSQQPQHVHSGSAVAMPVPAHIVGQSGQTEIPTAVPIAQSIAPPTHANTSSGHDESDNTRAYNPEWEAYMARVRRETEQEGSGHMSNMQPSAPSWEDLQW